MATCYLCNESLSETDISTNISKEHIILNSIGGRLKSKELLCKTCNSKFGEEADKELAKQFSFLSSYFQVKRDSGENQMIKGLKTADGEEYNIVNGSKPMLSKPKIEIKSENGKTNYSIKARDIKEGLQILSGLKRKHPQIDLELAKKYFQEKEEYLDEYLEHNMTIGGDLAFKSIAKSAVNFYIYKKKENNQVKHLFDYLKGKEELKIAQHFHPIEPIYRIESDEIFHLLHLYGNKRKKLLYCYVEFFSSLSFLVLLSDEYDGEDFSETYCYDLLNNKEVEKLVNLELEKEEIAENSKKTEYNFKIITQKLSRVLKIGSKIQINNEIDNIGEKIIEKMFDQYKHEPVFTEEMISEFSREIATAFVKFVCREKKTHESF